MSNLLVVSWFEFSLVVQNYRSSCAVISQVQKYVSRKNGPYPTLDEI